MRNSLFLVLSFLLLTPAWADVIELTDGRKISGRVSKKDRTYTIKVEGQELIFDESEVSRHCKTPKQFIGDKAKLYDEAKNIFLEAIEISDLSAQSLRMEDAHIVIRKAREIYAETRDHFGCFRHAFRSPDVDRCGRIAGPN